MNKDEYYYTDYPEFFNLQNPEDQEGFDDYYDEEIEDNDEEIEDNDDEYCPYCDNVLEDCICPTEEQINGFPGGVD